MGRRLLEKESEDRVKLKFSSRNPNTPSPFEYLLTDVRKLGKKTIRTERVTKKEMQGWEAYADLRFFAAIALAKSSPAKALQEWKAGMKMWDETGFNDAVVPSAKRYATYKLSLAILAAKRIGQLDKIPNALIKRLKSMQNKAGGWVTDYKPDGTPIGFANVETTSLAILSLEALKEHRPE